MVKKIFFFLFCLIAILAVLWPGHSPSNASAKVLITATTTRTPTPINIGDFVWDDMDMDGIQDPGEPGVYGLTVQLWNAARTQMIDATTTNFSGNYTLMAPTPGDYRIRVILSGMKYFSPKDQGIDDTKDSDINPTGVDSGFTDIFTITNNEISTTIYDAGLIVHHTPTVTRSPTPNLTQTQTQTPTPTRTPTPTGAKKVFLPVIKK